MSGMFGGLRPTHRYSRIVWGEVGSQQTIDLQDPLQGAVEQKTPVGTSSIASSRRRETVFERMDTVMRILTPIMRNWDAARIERWLDEHALRGRQFEFFVDRVMRAQWGFDDDTPLDNNRGNAFINGPWTGSVFSYEDFTEGRGLTLPSAGRLVTPLISTLPGGSGNAFMSASEGILVLHFKPTWASGDSADHQILSAFVSAGPRGKNHLRVVKHTDNVLRLIYMDSTTQWSVLETTPGWSANAEQKLMIMWGAAATDFRASLNGTELATRRYGLNRSGNGVRSGNGARSGATTATPGGTETVWNAAPNALVLGTDADGLGGRGSGGYGLLAVYQATLVAALPPTLLNHVHPWRSYYPKGELVDPRQGALRLKPELELHQYQFAIRDGR
jgi:hypothetical protein